MLQNNLTLLKPLKIRVLIFFVFILTCFISCSKTNNPEEICDNGATLEEACEDCDATNPQHTACYCSNQNSFGPECYDCDYNNPDHLACFIGELCNNTLVDGVPCSDCDSTNNEHLACYISTECDNLDSTATACSDCDINDSTHFACFGLICDNLDSTATATACPDCAMNDSTHLACNSLIPNCDNGDPLGVPCSDCDPDDPTHTACYCENYIDADGICVLVEITDVFFKNVIHNPTCPDRVEITFALRDQEGHAVTPNDLTTFYKKFEVYEKADNDDRFRKTDKNEVFYQVNTADQIPMDIVIVLDYTNSMNVTNAISPQIEAAISLIDSVLTSPVFHRVAVLEHHRKDSEPALIPGHPDGGLTNDFKGVIQAIKDFEPDEYGKSRVYDAAYAGLQSFSNNDTVTTVKALVFLTDGSSTGNTHDDLQVTNLAKQKKVQIYSLGFGEMESDDIQDLIDLSNSTEGIYMRVASISQILSTFSQIARDLRGQYKLTYITGQLRDFEVKLNVNWTSLIETETKPISIKITDFPVCADIFTGLLDVTGTGKIEGDSTSVFFVNADYLPSKIDQFVVTINTQEEFEISISENSILGDTWVVTKEQNTYRLTDTTNTFGAISKTKIGNLFKIEFKNLQLPGYSIPIAFDTSIYSNSIVWNVNGTTEETVLTIGDTTLLAAEYPIINSIMNDTSISFNEEITLSVGVTDNHPDWSVLWDFNGDGSWDDTTQNISEIKHLYSEEEVIAATTLSLAKVIDVHGLESETIISSEITFEIKFPLNLVPSNTDTVMYTVSELTWRAGTYNDSSRVLLSEINPPTDTLGLTTNNSITIGVPLDSNTTYYWQVVGFNAEGDSAKSAVNLFYTKGLEILE